MAFDYVTRMPSLTICGVSSFTSLAIECLFWYVQQSFFTDGCSAVSCDFGVLLTVDELKVLFLCHLVKVPLRG